MASSSTQAQRDSVVQLFGSYTSMIRERDAARRAAEGFDRQRRAQWVIYYKLEEKLKTMEIDLGLVEATTQCNLSDDEEKSQEVPENNRKRRCAKN